MRVLFWQNMPSHIQAPALREFSRLWPDQTYGVWCADISQARRAMGWQSPDHGQMREVTLPPAYREKVHSLVEENRDAIHVLSGVGSYAPIAEAFRHALRVGARHFAVIGEPGIRMGWRGLLRPLRARLLARPYVAHVRALLAMGGCGVDYYRRAGFPREALYPYMYQCESGGPDVARPVGDPIRLVYVGKFMARKGVDVMLRGLGRCASRNWRLTIIGDGPEAPALRRVAQDCGLEGMIEWVGVKPSSEIPDLLPNYDLCLVPSRFEGWGVVTNEALTAGLAVVCSDRTTSLDLVSASGAGAVFQTGDSRDLGRVMDRLLSSPPTIAAMKERAMAYKARISPQCVGEYLKDVLEYAFLGKGVRPQPAWLNGSAPRAVLAGSIPSGSTGSGSEALQE